MIFIPISKSEQDKNPAQKENGNEEAANQISDIHDLIDAEGLAAYHNVDITDLEKDIERK